jgi:hypothetical protein
MKATHFFVTGIVAERDGKPYIQISTEEGMVTQFSMNEARQVAMDILIQASRTEMDAMILSFLKNEVQAPEAAMVGIVQMFREFRAALDDEQIQHDHRVPPQDG